jgi:hypothetical protein
MLTSCSYIARNRFPTKIKEAEAVRKLLDATIGQFKGYSAGGFDTQIISRSDRLLVRLRSCPDGLLRRP